MSQNRSDDDAKFRALTERQAKAGQEYSKLLTKMIEDWNVWSPLSSTGQPLAQELAGQFLQLPDYFLKNADYELALSMWKDCSVEVENKLSGRDYMYEEKIYNNIPKVLDKLQPPPADKKTRIANVQASWRTFTANLRKQRKVVDDILKMDSDYRVKKKDLVVRH